MDLVSHAVMLFGNGEGRTTSQLEDGMSAPDTELLEIGYSRLMKRRLDMMTYATNRGLFGGE